jgi:sulfoxide reductase heme-binding subunit YedZ
MSPTTHWFWILSRGAGTTALVLSAATICYGLLMAGAMKQGSAGERRAYHEVLALSTLVAIAAHGLLLLGDPFLHPDLADITVPFVTSYKTLWTSLGIIAGWTTAAIALSFYARDRIGRSRYAVIHRLVLVAWVLGLIHAFVEGTDAGQAWFIALIVVSSSPAIVLLGLRLAGRPLPTSPRGRRRPRPAEAPAGLGTSLRGVAAEISSRRPAPR